MYRDEGFFLTDLRQSQNYLRVIVHPLPARFSIEHFLYTGKSTDKHHHGMHISSNALKSTRSSISSRGSLSEYDIWRSWEDCLWFQQSLEDEYERAAREKKMRLTQGKGVKGFNGLYKKDMASSWESLPPGPNPDSVAQDIHKHLPSLTKRGTLFKTSQATINQRQAELIALTEALFSDDMPALIKEIRASSVVSDFFGHWRRDYEFTQASEITNTVPRNSLTNSVFSSYFSTSHPTLPSSNTSPCNSPPKTPFKRSLSTLRLLSFASSTEISEEQRSPCGSLRRSRPRPHSTSSDSSAHSEASSDTSLSLSIAPSIADDVPIVFGHNPLNPSDRSNSVLEVLPEEQGIVLKTPEPYRPVTSKSRASMTERKAHRSYSIFGLSLRQSSLAAEKSDDRSVRESWQTTDSRNSTVNDVLDGLSLMLPHPIKEEKFRASVASVSTFMTTDSADAVIPSTSSTKKPCSLVPGSRISAPLSLSDFDVYSDTDDSYSVLDAFPRPVSFIPLGPGNDLPMPDSPSSTCTTFNRPASPAYSALSSSMFSTTTTSTSIPVDPISIKAIHNSAIILLRVSRGIGFADVRQRLYNKFIGQEGIPLSQAYNIAFVPSAAGAYSQSASANRMGVQLIATESDWEQLMSSLQGNKIILRILDV